ncbi:hypothetical protein EMIHUDRAFT_110115 [Emiliania huxleyi CCMP1516]|uniref:Kelch repeat protein n=2 Tax=Emiliania huxleyi TaxID=2903 RepID=A0A0D3KLJ8_EMIH1|nr:hypothetical protein EMIHUDRAFT_110115 [Emiliania huxleyi CCMP1516]EOD36633.1 hypothetical protein EMIHUDRAFT_110115 [Emiliania huxleyi CCMP1516]|eukprot:XP_005789062.1 hypothetical protein EMIHUDRAFT_110115 [Emiliania huxleyi CCMP1516]
MPDNATTLAAWDVVLPEHRPMIGDSTHPSVRYSACVVWHEGRIVVTHGYFYNHDIRQPAWLSDAWVFEVSRGAWRQVHRGERHGAPSARYSASAVVFDGGLYMYGGDDGGHKHSLHNYVFKAWNSELWRLDLSSFTWSSVTPVGRAPPKRALHSQPPAAGDAMYVYGGLERDDTWRFSFAARAAPDGRGFFVFGGTRRGKPGSRSPPTPLDDLWHFDATTRRWSLLTQSGLGHGPVPLAPAARSHASLVAAPPDSLLLYGGAHCTPGCTCYGDAWVYAGGGWRRVSTPSSPTHRYRQGVVRDPSGGAFYLFGGEWRESYKPYMRAPLLPTLQPRLSSPPARAPRRYHNAIDRLIVPSLKPQPGAEPAFTAFSAAGEAAAPEGWAAVGGGGPAAVCGGLLCCLALWWARGRAHRSAHALVAQGYRQGISGPL